MILLLAHLAAAQSTDTTAPAAEAAPSDARAPAGRTYPSGVAIAARPAPYPGNLLTPERRLANTPGLVMDRRGNVLEIRGAAPVLYVDGVRVMTGVRR